VKRASIVELKARLSEYVRAVKAGQEVIVTERGRPVARLAPIGGETRGGAHLDQLIQTGLARPPIKGLPADFWKRPRPKDPDGRTLRAVIEEREEGR